MWKKRSLFCLAKAKKLSNDSVREHFISTEILFTLEGITSRSFFWGSCWTLPREEELIVHVLFFMNIGLRFTKFNAIVTGLISKISET